jgi:predicted  nucleic acid-binding Zn-ribbon protein
MRSCAVCKTTLPESSRADRMTCGSCCRKRLQYVRIREEARARNRARYASRLEEARALVAADDRRREQEAAWRF